MKILGNAINGDLIIQVSQIEWDRLQDGIKPTSSDDYLKRYYSWPDTEIGQLFLANKGLRGMTAIRSAFLKRETDGTIKDLINYLDNHFIRNLGKSGHDKLKNLLAEKLDK